MHLAVRKGSVMKYETLADLIAYEIEPALGKYADDFDMESIANEAYEYAYPNGYKQRENVDFWEVASKYDISNNAN